MLPIGKYTIEQQRLRLGMRVRYLRIKKNLKQEELAKLSKTSRMTLSQLENGVSNAHLDLLFNVSDALDVEPGYLLADFSEPPFDKYPNPFMKPDKEFLKSIGAKCKRIANREDAVELINRMSQNSRS